MGHFGVRSQTIRRRVSGGCVAGSRISSADSIADCPGPKRRSGVNAVVARSKKKS